MYVKTVATIGPKCESAELLAQMIEAGLNIARINFSHATEQEVRSRVAILREFAERDGIVIPVLQDLMGPRIRIGELEGGSRELNDGEEITFYTYDAPDPQPNEIPIRDKNLHNDITEGKQILIESGRFRARVSSVDIERQRIHATLEKGGTLLSNKGVNVPYVRLTNATPTEKDKKDILLGKELNFEYVAASFVQTAEDIHRLRELLLPTQKIIAKIEDPLGVDNIDEIIAAADGIMVARGDLGVELPLEEIPLIQKEIVAKCRYAGKPSIVATQMLMSMVKHPTPTRAEVSDVANAVMDGADAVMLSDETAQGDYPIEALKTLVKVAQRTEDYLYNRKNKFDTD